MYWWNEKRKRLIEASTLSILLIISVLTVTYAYVEPDSWSSPAIWVQDSSSDASGADGQEERELLYLGVDYDEDYLYVRWDVEQIPENIEQIYYILIVAVGSSTVTDVATHSLQFDVDGNGGMSVSIRTPNHPQFVTQWTGNLSDWSVTPIPIGTGDPFTMRTALEGRFPWSVLTGGDPIDVWILTAQSHASASDKGWTSAIKDAINIQDVLSPLDMRPPTMSNVDVDPSIGPIGTIFTISVDAFDRSGVKSVVAYIQKPDETNVATIILTDLDSDGTYTGLWNSSGESAGTYLIDIVAKDTLDNSDETENAATMSVTKISSSITCFVSPLTLILGDEVTVTGSLEPLLTTKTITLTFTRPDGSTFTRNSTANPGDYSDVYIPDTVGIWSVSASWDGDVTHEGASSSSTSFTVKKIYIPKIPKISSSITCSVSPLTLILGEEVTVIGSLNPLHTDKTITLTFIRPDYSTFTKRASARVTQGGYSDIFTPDMVGMWSVSASWGGDATHKGASSSSTSFVVHVPPEAIFTYSPSTDLSVFSLITFSDTSTDLDGTIISWLWDFGDNTASSDQNLTHMYADKGIYLVTLTVIDNDGYVGDSSQSVIISNLPPIAAFTYSPERPMVEQEIVFTDLSEDPEGEILTYLWNFGDEATSTEKHPHHTYAAYGTYTVTLTVTDDEGATDIHSTSFTVTTLSTSITLSVLASELPIGGSVTVTGSISPPVSGVTVTLTYTNPNGSTFTRTSTANPGDYSDVYIPDTVGIWSVSASWGGDATHEGASSSSTSFIIKSLECLIATATYGSELSQNVQFLRGFRDNDVLNTFAGSNFMTVFNGFYYSFSPNVASVISSNEGLRGVSKVVLYPLMGILHLSSATFSLFSFNLELGIVMAGLVASVLIGVFYFLPVALLLSLVRKIKISAKIIRLIGLIWAGSFMMIFIAEVTKSPLMMMVSTGAFVLVTISAAMLTSLRIILKRLI